MSKQLQFTYVLLTYKTHIDKVLYIQWLRSKFSIKEVQLAHETGSTDEGYDHTHVVIYFARQYRSRCQSLREFDYLDIHPNIKALVGSKAYKDALVYIAKEDTSVVVQPPSLCEQVWECESLDDALIRFVTKPSDTPGIMALYNAKPKHSLWKSIELRDWQLSFYEIIKDTYSERKVYWIHSDGNSGKTYFMKYMLQEHSSDTVLVADAYLSRDICLVFKNAIEQNNTCKYVLFDCSRAFSFPNQFYATLERVKDGLMTSTKYNSCTLSFCNSVLVVMSNQYPDISKLSFDRWNVYNIESGKLISIATTDVVSTTTRNISESY